MTEKLKIDTERIDDIPALMAQLDRMQGAAMLDDYFPPHGNWQGLSLGPVAAVWLTFTLSETNHRLSHGQPWVEALLTLAHEHGFALMYKD